MSFSIEDLTYILLVSLIVLLCYLMYVNVDVKVNVNNNPHQFFWKSLSLPHFDETFFYSIFD